MIQNRQQQLPRIHGDEGAAVSAAAVAVRAKKEIAVLGASDLALKAEEVGLQGSDLRTEKIFFPAVGKGAELLEGNPEEIASKLFDILKDKGGLV